ncbi:MAG: superinfection immunity protein, partial [Mycobacteriales bacterium]
ELAAADLMRRSSPDYRRGWNSIPDAPRPQVPTATNDADQGQVGPPAESSAASSADLVTQPAITPQSGAPAEPPASQGSAAPVLAGAVLGGGLIIVAIAVGLAMYFLPTLVAMLRHKKNAGAIFALNLFLGWTFLGWLGALIWSLLAEPVAYAQ